jgi:phytoene dehydrogenase-like protein
MSRKKVIIIGSGISGLAAGSYLQMNGFETAIYEKHSAAGGLCTNWNRNGYRFESGLQWILGSMAGNPFYHLWSELIDMRSIRFVNHETRMEIEVKDHCDINGSNTFHLYTSIDRLEAYMLSIAPEDERTIRKLIRMIWKIQSFEIPPMIKAVPQLLPIGKKIGFARFLPLLLFLNQIRKITNFSFAANLKNPFLKEAFMLLFDGDELPLLILTLPLAFSDRHATGYPIGGSGVFVGKLEEKYLALGGQIHFESPVNKILVTNNIANGIELGNGTSVAAEFILSSADWHYTIYQALEGRYVNKQITRLNDGRTLKVYYSAIMISLGVAKTFENAPHFFRFPVEQKLESPDGTGYTRLEAHIYNYDPTLAPEGKTVISLTFYTQNGQYWINLRNGDRAQYDHQKQQFAEQVIGLLETRLGPLRPHIEVTDVATPATFFRYTGNRQGSVQGWLPGKNMIARSPVGYSLPGLKNFYYSSHWSIPGGGLPAAIKSARDVAQILCHENKIKFRIT